MSNKRPFFSIVIPCYNTSQKHMKRLLSSIYLDFAARDTEVIIVDDNSTDKGFLNVVDDFIRFGKMRIKKVTVPENTVHCPGNTREYGVQFCTGEWLTFIDHDDFLTTNALFTIRHIIKKYKEKRYFSSGFKKITNGKEQGVVYGKPSSSFIHGKYFNLDNFWRKYDIHFKKDMKLEEDVYIVTTCGCILESIGESRCNYNKETYVWDINENSFGSTDIDNISTVMLYYDDYIAATNTVYHDMYKSDKINKEIYEKHSISGFLSLYTIMEKFFYDYYNEDKKKYDNDYKIVLNSNIIYTRDAINRFKNEMNYKNEDIINHLKKDLTIKDTIIRNNIFATGPMMFTHTFTEWLYLNSQSISDDVEFCNTFYKEYN